MTAPAAVAVVLTHRRPRLATQVVRGLIDVEGFPPERVVLVINGEGGLDDPDLEQRVVTVRLPVNTGPAGGFRAGLDRAAGMLDDELRWVYVCEDDVGLFDLPAPRVAAQIEALEQLEGEPPVGALLAYGRDMDWRTGLTEPRRPAGPDRFEPVDVGSWGASLVSGRVLRAGVLPDPAWFFGYEDFDYWLQIRAAGFRLLLDVAAARAEADRPRDLVFVGHRPLDAAEPWRAYYVARNFLELRRRHGRWSWTAWHLVRSVRRFQLAGGWSGRRAILAGLVDGFRHRLGQHPRYQRDTGELPSAGLTS